MTSKQQYERDMAMVVPRFRLPLEAYIADGILPIDVALLALLGGDVTSAVKLYGGVGTPISGTIVFVEAHVPDIAWGHMVYVARWHLWGGENGRNGRLH